jgi:nucleoside-diphosphate-sugar epimerase
MPTGSQAATRNTRRAEMAAAPVCAVTGANGYVGSILTKALSAAGMRVVPLRRSVPAVTAGEPALLFRLGDPVVPEVWAGVDVLIHCAYDFAARSWNEVQRINVHGSLQVFEAARAAGVRRLIFISSMSSFPNCRSQYGRAKLAVEERATELGLIIVRPGIVYGTRPGGMVGALRQLVRSMPMLPLVGRGDQILYPVHEEDLGRLIAHLCVCSDPPTGQPIIAASDQPCTFRRLLEGLARTERKNVWFVRIPAGVAWAALKGSEALGARSRLHSDSLVGLINQNPRPDFTATRRTGIAFREFGLG